MSAREHTITEDDAGQTLAAIVRVLVAGASWGKARELCASGRATIDGEIERDGARRLALGEVVVVDPEGRRRPEGQFLASDVLFSDADVIVVRKQPGVMTCPFEDGDRGTLVDRVRSFLRQHGGGRDPMVGVVQRLDKDTSGVLVFARSMRGKRGLEEQLRAHTVLRRYVAIAHGVVREAKIESLIMQDRGDGLRGSWGSRPSHRGDMPLDAKRAVTHVRPLEALKTREGTEATLVECRLETGRQHQIRIHLSEAGHPLLGEPVYIRDLRGPRIEAPRPMLHARELGFVHPGNGRPVHFEDPPPADFERCLTALRGGRGG
jgi:23S rRNA pseudouridine1911/1915/1917 synthase